MLFRSIQSGAFRPWTNAEAMETRVIDHMNHFSQVDGYVQTTWGGRKDLGEPTNVVGTAGFFRVGQFGSRWYLIDPEQGAMMVRGTQHVVPGDSDEQKSAFNSKFGNVEKWSQATGAMLQEYDFNYVSYGAKRIERFPAEGEDNILRTSERRNMSYAWRN